ncbi:cyclase family protein [Sphingobium sp. EP60837]|uniref:cyclase family protein n=1 Tax=Sphingobium sp. EP60837 TaxID=1855519 RepID=UPI0007DDED15|nr:cyclase family protein [Sphingobium sp. EP60837]ANI79149.1 DNA-directed RNA polymerase [Sphingobium sp. EP60837]
MIDRRAVLAASLVTAFASRTPEAFASAVSPDDATIKLHGRRLEIVDLTHRLTRAFAFTPGRLSMEAVEGSGTGAGMRLNRLSIVEHTGTHLDAPRHFSPGGRSVGDLSIADLVVPLVVIDIRAKRQLDRDAQVGPEDLAAWETKHGSLPAGCCVAMLSAWDPLAEVARYGSLSPEERRKSPGFSRAAADLLLKRDVRGIAVDTLSLDAGRDMPAYPVHRSWLRSGRWGLEAVANLDRAPASGAIMFVGAPPIAEATGIPIRAIALF